MTRSPRTDLGILPWAERIKKAVQVWRHWERLPAGPRMDRVFKEAGVRDLVVALERIAGQQQMTLATIKANGFVFEDIGSEPGNWQHLAFTIYTDLCEIDSIARGALENG